MDKILGVILTLSTGLFFSAGYLFLYSYYNVYGIGVTKLELNIHDILVHAVIAVQASFYNVFVLMPLMVFSSGVVWLLKKQILAFQYKVIFWLTTTVSLFFLLTLIFAPSVGETQGNADLRYFDIVMASDITSPELTSVLSILKDVDQSPLNTQISHITTSESTIFLLIEPIGSKFGGDYRWVARLSKEGDLRLLTYFEFHSPSALLL